MDRMGDGNALGCPRGPAYSRVGLVTRDAISESRDHTHATPRLSTTVLWWCNAEYLSANEEPADNGPDSA